MQWPFKWNLFSSTFTWYYYLVCCSNFWVYGSNPMVLPFKWKLYSSTFTWYYSVADADLHIGGGWSSRPWDGGGGGGGLKKLFFSAPRASFWGALGLVGPLPGSATAIDFSEVVFTKRYMEILLIFTLAIFGSERLKPLIQKPFNAGMTLEHQSMFSTHGAISH